MEPSGDAEINHRRGHQPGDLFPRPQREKNAMMTTEPANALSRREYLKQLAAASAAAWMAGEPRLISAAESGEKIEHPKPTADTCILLWMAGGMAAPETFDPKRYTPFEVGLPVEKVLSTFPAIDTAVDNIKICQGLENVAEGDGSRRR